MLVDMLKKSPAVPFVSVLREYVAQQGFFYTVFQEPSGGS